MLNISSDFPCVLHSPYQRHSFSHLVPLFPSAAPNVVLLFRIPLRAFLRIIWAALPCGAVQRDYAIHLRVLSGRAWLRVWTPYIERCALEGEEGTLLATPVLKSGVDGRLSCFVKNINRWFQIFSSALYETFLVSNNKFHTRTNKRYNFVGLTLSLLMSYIYHVPLR